MNFDAANPEESWIPEELPVDDQLTLRMIELQLDEVRECDVRNYALTLLMAWMEERRKIREALISQRILLELAPLEQMSPRELEYCQ